MKTADLIKDSYSYVDLMQGIFYYLGAGSSIPSQDTVLLLGGPLTQLCLSQPGSALAPLPTRDRAAHPRHIPGAGALPGL